MIWFMPGSYGSCRRNLDDLGIIPIFPSVETDDFSKRQLWAEFEGKMIGGHNNVLLQPSFSPLRAMLFNPQPPKPGTPPFHLLEYAAQFYYNGSQSFGFG
jgi:hypothetical protein